VLPTDAIAYSGLALLVAGQAAGAPLPAETALIGAAVLAAHDQLDIVAVIAVAAAAATLGGFVGFAVGYALGRPALARLARQRPRIGALIAAGERFFARHGAKAVFLARWVSGVRIVAAPVAGAHAMPAATFAWWNVAGGLLWPTSMGLVAYLLGQKVAVLLGVGVVAVALMLIVARRRRVAREELES
jgi:membrane protein DedA with SNARE-associated domain